MSICGAALLREMHSTTKCPCLHPEGCGTPLIKRGYTTPAIADNPRPLALGGEVVWYGVNRATPMHLFQLRIDDAQRDSGTANVIMRGTRSKWGVEA